ncbi:OmpA family protein [Cognatilysobacter terrigena]|uniref:OmpA family protein n=1 Tax=Cognatilysobacter terrigena TaxID=2488749 RepID=UPI001FE6AA65|nr:OmpA family protein [Lysobacter terrigena]
MPPPTSELSAAQQAVARAGQADADQYAGAELAAAQRELSQAQAAISAGKDDDARRLALQAAADADLAIARSRVATVTAARAQRQAEVAELQARLQVEPDAGASLPAAPADAVGNYAGRLQMLAADPRLADTAQLERSLAQQAVDALATVKGKQRPAAEALAERRVRAAELAAYAQALQRDTDRLERTYTELQLEATRRDAAAARAEADRLRMEAQMQAEEAERLRQAAAEQEQARVDAETALQGAATQQAAKLSAAREKELKLAREEAELVADAKLPPMKRDSRGEVFTLAGDAFASGQATLTPAASGTLKALAHYIDVSRAAAVRVDGFTDNQGNAADNQALSQRRAAAVRQTLVAAGAGSVRIDVSGHGASNPVADNGSAAGRAKNRRVEIVVTQK